MTAPEIGVFYLTIAFVGGAAGTAIVRAYALRAELMDVPNQRSSHEVATPRGGGLSVVVVSLGTLLALYLGSSMLQGPLIALFVGGLTIAAVGFVDDHRHVPAVWRFIIQLAAAIGIVWSLGGLPPVQLGAAVIDLGLFGDCASILFIVWCTNAFNFMDGIDGIAAVETICIATGIVLLPSVADSGAMAFLLAGLAAATAGFLVWNWPPAKIFMGDVGSSFVGFVLAAIALFASVTDIMPLSPWLIMGGVFIVDATVTLVTRMIRREKWHIAHRSHAYQILSRRLGSHLKVTLLVLAINVMWLYPLAFLSYVRPEFGWWATLLAWFPLAAAVVWIGAGRPDKPNEIGRRRQPHRS